MGNFNSYCKSLLAGYYTNLKPKHKRTTMGPYLSTPNKDKDSENGESSTVRYGATSMQGWRKSQEDAHIAHLDLDEDMSLFGVFDGHGGKEVSIFVKAVFKDELLKLESFKAKEYEKALKEVFKKMMTCFLQMKAKRNLRKSTQTVVNRIHSPWPIVTTISHNLPDVLLQLSWSQKLTTGAPMRETRGLLSQGQAKI